MSKNKLIVLCFGVIFLFLTLNFHISISTETRKIPWSQIYGDRSGGEGARAIIQTNDGGFAIVGAKEFSFSSFSEEIWLVKTDADGKEDWNQTYSYPHTEDNRACDIVQTSDGGFILTGYSTYHDWVIVSYSWSIKTDANGVMQWNQTYRGEFWSELIAVIQTSDGGFILAGTIASYNNSDAWLVKIDTNGITQWSRIYETFDFEGASAFIQTNDGGFALAGYVSEEKPYSEKKDFLLIKTDVNGNMLWKKSFGSNRCEEASAIIQTSDGGFVLAGKSSIEHSDYQCLFVKTDTNGTMQWNQTYEYGDNSIYCEGAIQTSDGGFALIGAIYYSDLSDYDGWLLKTDADGAILWNQTYDCVRDEFLSDEHLFDLVQTDDDGLALVGRAPPSSFWLIRTNSTGHPPQCPLTSTSGIPGLMLGPFLTAVLALVYRHKRRKNK